MPFDPRTLHGLVTLCEPSALQRAIAALQAHPTCPTARHMAARRQRGRDEAIAGARADLGRRGAGAAPGTVGVISVRGVIQQRRDAAMEKVGGTSTEEVSLAIKYLLAEPRCEGILLSIDSGGGGVSGVEELADEIVAARKQKPVWAIADSLAASAAYWIGAAAERLYCTVGGMVGSVGVFAVHVSEAAALEQAGVKVSVVSAGQYKAEFLPYNDLSDNAREYLQETIDSVYRRFINSVARNRGVSASVVERDFGQGRVVGAEKALQAGMIDGISTGDELLTAMSTAAGPPRGSTRARASADVFAMRVQHELRKRETHARARSWTGARLRRQFESRN